MSEEKEKSYEIPSRKGRYIFYPENIPLFEKPTAIEAAPPASINEIATSQHRARVILLSYETTQNGRKSIYVVQKPLHPEELRKEIITYGILTQFPVIPSLAVAYTWTDGNNYSLATVARPQLFSFEAKIREQVADYQSLPPSEATDYLTPNMDFYFSAGLLALLRLHQCGIMHADPAPKNIVVDNSNGDIFAHDFEGALARGYDHGRRVLSLPESSIEIKHYCRWMSDEYTFIVPSRMKQLASQRIIMLHNQIYNHSLFSTFGWNEEKEQIAKDMLQL